MEQLTVRINKEIADIIREQAKEQSRSYASVVREILIKFLSNI